MQLCKIFPDGIIYLDEGYYKFLVVSKTSQKNDAIFIYGGIKTRHFLLMYLWMKEISLSEAYTFGGGRMSVSINDDAKTIQLFSASSDFGFTSMPLVEILGEGRRCIGA